MKEESTVTIPCYVAGTVYQNSNNTDATCVTVNNTGVLDLASIYDPNHISIDIKSKKITIMDFTGQYVEYDILSMHSVFDKKFDCSKQDKHVIIAERVITVPEIKLLIQKEILTDFFDVEEDRYGLKNIELTLNFRSAIYTRELDRNKYHITIPDYVPNDTSIGITGTGGNAGIFTTTVQPFGITTCTAVIDQAAISKTVLDYQAIFNST